MTEYKPWPDFDKPRPVDDWPNPLHWVAAKAIHEGATQAEAAVEVKRVRSTVSNWVERWRDVYGPDFLPAKPALTDENRGSQLGGMATKAKWQAHREDRAAGLGSIAGLAVEVAEVGLLALLEGDRAKELDALDLERISRVAERLLRAADRLATPLGVVGAGGAPTGIPAGLLDGLETKPGQHDSIHERLDVVYQTYTKIRTVEAGESGGPEIIDL